jgi:UDP-GlcNAc:undecaprenyl-phosphate GlcNAc-1-phosphate transferase
MHSPWIPTLVAVLAAVVLTPVAQWLALRLGVVDAPDGVRKLQRAPVPLLGGVAIYLAIVAGLGVALWMAPGRPRLLELSTLTLCSAGLICAFGCLDDWFELRPRQKLLLQMVAILPLLLGGHWVRQVEFLGITLELAWWGVPLTMFWLLACVNSLNLLDGMDGLASLVTIVTASIMAAIAAASGLTQVSMLCLVVAGATAGFLAYNLPPARIYLGDSGSMLLGLLLGVLALHGAMKTATSISIAVPLVLLTVPLLDTSLAIVRRRLSGVRVCSGDRRHLHHCLLGRGLSVRQSLCIVGGLCLATGGAAALAAFLGSDLVALALAAAVLALLVRSGWFGATELSLVKLAAARGMLAVAYRWLDGQAPDTTVAMSAAGVEGENAWRRLQDIAQTSHATRMRLILASEDGSPAIRQWSPLAAEDATDPAWTHTAEVMGSDGRLCELQIAGYGPHRPDPREVLRLVRVLATAAAADDAGESPALRLPAAEDRPRRRAAA